MNSTAFSTTAYHQKEILFRKISLTALLTGILSLVSIFVKNFFETGESPVTVLRYIASGAFGKEAWEGGKLMIIWGIVFHFMIAFLFTAILFLVHPKISPWIKNKLITGIIYGLFTWAMMSFFVLPVSSIHQYPADINHALIDASVLILSVGLPVAFIAGRFYTQKTAA